MKSYQHEGVTVSSRRPLSDYMPALAFNLVKVLGSGSHFVADVLRQHDNRGTLFEPGTKRMTQEMRVRRTFETPVLVGDVLVSLLELPKTKNIYEKRIKFVLRRGESLPPLEVPVAQPHGFVPSKFTTPVDEPAASPQASVPVPTFVPMPSGGFEGVSRAEFEALTRRVAALEARPAAAVTSVQPMPSAAPAADPPCPERFLVLPLSRRRLPRPTFTYIVGELEENLARLHERLGLPAPPRGPVAAEHGLADVAERGLRAYRAARAVLVGLPDLDDLRAPEEALRLPVAAWEEVGPRLSWASQIISRVSTSRDDREIRRWRAPELEDHSSEE